MRKHSPSSTATVKATPGVAAATAAPIKPGQQLAIIQVVPTTSPQDKGTTDLINTLAVTSVIPQAESGTTMRVYVGGLTAIFNDFSHVLTEQAAAVHRRDRRCSASSCC